MRIAVQTARCLTKAARIATRAARIALQTALLWLLAAVCNRVATALHVPVPGSILGCAVLFLLLLFRVVPLAWVEAGADWLIAQLLLFFLPPAVGIIQYPALIRADGWRLLLVILTSTALVMAITGAVADAITRRRQRRAHPLAHQALTGRRSG
ncbi:CidA/LrgA family protein [Alicyclobacillus macrosporangiidus]|uniref:Holin-like protein n=1 Tax=Alicyclobacillus macrosporangiidus TaxID=392015 RepID=A0A1I7FE50_9BACL|nr:CidA/LrgA family protein [Alicyclobacillus macrosporangiidus]SFU34421.1 holin-like protein [Alicyclobacillus macrosporangiidus]